MAYPTTYAADKIQWPGPTIAVHGDDFYLAFVTMDGRALELQSSDDQGQAWSQPHALAAYNSSVIQKPWMAINPGGTMLAVAWQGNQSGYWDTYLSACPLPCRTPQTPITVSDHEGYPSSVLNWHGDFLGSTFSVKQPDHDCLERWIWSTQLLRRGARLFLEAHHPRLATKNLPS